MSSTSNVPAGATPITPDLVEPAKQAFRGLLWSGLILLAIAGVFMVMAFGQSSYEVEAQYGQFSVAGSATLWAVILLAASGIVAGLGKREDGPPAKPATASPASTAEPAGE